MSSQRRESAQELVESKTRNNENIERIKHFSKEETEETIGLSWTNLSRIYFSGDSTVNEIEKIKESLKSEDFLVTIDEDKGGPVLEVQATIDVYERMG